MPEPSQYFRRSVPHRPAVGQCPLSIKQKFSEPKVNQLQVAVQANNHIFGLEISVHYGVVIVECLKAVGQLCHLELEGPAPLGVQSMVLPEASQGLALNEVKHETDAVERQKGVPEIREIRVLSQ